MPHGESWFTLSHAYQTLQMYAHLLGLPFNEEGRTWLGHQPITTGHVLATVLVLLVLIVFAIATRRHSGTEEAIVPSAKLTIPTFVELVVTTLYETMVGVMGAKEAKFFLPLIGACGFFILFSNTLGLVPGFRPPTDTVNTNIAMAILIFLATHVYGVKHHGLAYFKHFFGPNILSGFDGHPVMKWAILAPIQVFLAVLLFGVETFSHSIRVVTLSLRLAANMVADHAVVSAFLLLVPFLVPVPFMLLGLLVVLVQTFVFCLLSTVYISLAIADDH